MTQTGERLFELRIDDDVAIATLADKRYEDEKHIQRLGDAFFRLVDEQGRRKIILNFKDVEFYSSAGLGKLITLNRKTGSVRGKLVLCGITDAIRETFEITKLDKLFRVVSTLDVALLEFGK